jgi:alpha-tubulin suppressor-like RCC1 family protein
MQEKVMSDYPPRREKEMKKLCVILLLLSALIVSVQAGSLIAWGQNDSGECNVPAGNDFVKVYGGSYHFAAIRTDGSIVSWGRNSEGQCDIVQGNYTKLAPAGHHTIGLTNLGSLLSWTYDFGIYAVPSGNDFVDITSAFIASFGLRSNGTIVSWGEGTNNDILIVPTGSDFVKIDSGNWHAMALKSDGSVVVWGDNDETVQPVPPGNDYADIAGGYASCLALKTDGSLLAWGHNSSGQCDVPAGNDFIKIDASYDHCAALRSDSTLAVWGNNADGQCNAPERNDYLDVAVSYFATVAILANPVGVVDEIQPQAKLQAYPNPFNQSVNITLQSKSNAPVKAAVYNIKGQLIKSLGNGKALSWDGTDTNNQSVSNGIYFIQALQDGRTATSKVIRIK